MRKLLSWIAAAAAVAGFTSACTVAEPTEDEIGASSEAWCTNPEGTNAMIAALAVSIGRELGRWQIPTDFMIVRGTYNQEMLQLTNTGMQQCYSRGNQCQNTKALLAFQDARYDQMLEFPGNQKLSSWSYAARLVSGYREQVTCESRPSNNPYQVNNCPAEQHKLTHIGSFPGGCDTYHSFRATAPSGAPLAAPALLKNKLLWAGRDNPYIAFQSSGDVVSIDPVYGLIDVDNTTSGSCSPVCSRVSTSNVAGQCCSCNGRAGRFSASPTPNMYLCR